MNFKYLFAALLCPLFIACSGGSEETAVEVEVEEVVEADPQELLHLHIDESDTIPIPADMLFGILSSFAGVDQVVPHIVSACVVEGEGVGARRVLTMADGSGEIIENMTELDMEARQMVYTIESGPMPITDYESTISVDPFTETSCVFYWSSHFDATRADSAAMHGAISGLYKEVFKTLKTPPAQ